MKKTLPGLLPVPPNAVSVRLVLFVALVCRLGPTVVQRALVVWCVDGL